MPPPFQDQYRAVRSCFNTLFAVKRDSGFTKQAFALHCTPGKDGMKEENIFFLTSFEPFLSSSKLRYFPLSLTHTNFSQLNIARTDETSLGTGDSVTPFTGCFLDAIVLIPGYFVAFLNLPGLRLPSSTSSSLVTSL